MKCVRQGWRFVCAGATILTLIGNVAAATLTWGGMDGAWFDAGNWDTGTIPGANGETDLLVFNAGQATLDAGDATCGEVQLGKADGGTGTLVVSGGTLAASVGMFQIGYTAGCTGNYRQSGGDVTVAEKLRVGRHGRALFEMTGGTFTLAKDVEAPAYADATATIRILGGTFTQTYGWVNLGLVDGSSGTLEIADGGKLAITMENGRLYLGRGNTATGFATLRTGGTLACSHVNGRDASLFTFDGGTLQALSSTTVADRFIDAPVSITENGAIIDTQAFTAFTDRTLAGAGGLTKIGPGILQLAGANTYLGPTVISEGTLVAASAAALPGYDQPGRVTVADGARIIAGADWTPEQVAALKANVNYLGTGPFTVGTEYDTTDGDLTIADDLTLVDGFNKAGPNTLTLTGQNTFGASPVVMAGTLKADFGQGLDANQGVILQGGTLGRVGTDPLTVSLGAGAGQVEVRGGTAGFTARTTPLTAGLADGATGVFGSDAFPFTTFILNGAEANETLTWTTPLDLNGTSGASAIRTDAATAVVAAPFIDTPLSGNFHKTGAGALVFTGDVTQNRLYFDAGDGAFSNNTVTAKYIKANAANGSFDISGATVSTDGDGFNISNGSSVTLRNETTANFNKFNAVSGDLTLDDAAMDCSASFYGAVGTFTQLGGSVTVHGGDGAFRIGNSNATGYTYDLRGGSLTADGTISVSYRDGNTAGKGTLDQSGGSLTAATYIFFGHKSATWGYGTFSGGTTTLPSTDTGTFAAGYDGNGFVTVKDEADIDINYLMWIGRNNTVTSAVVRLEGGCVSTPQVRGTDKAPAGGIHRALIFDGGTLRAKPQDGKGKYVIADGSFIRELTHLWMADRGGTIDTDGNDATITQPITCNADIAHRWSFTDGSLTDEVTGMTGTVSGFSSGDSQSILLAGGPWGQSVLDLGANLIPAIDEPFTLEFWANNLAAQKNSRVFDIGDGEQNFLMLNWSNGTDTGKIKFELRHDGSNVNTNECLGGIGTGREYHFTITAAPNDEGRWVFTAYKRYASTGELRSSATFTADASWTPSHLVQSHFYLGHSQFPNDNDANATYNEVRVWSRALTLEEQQQSVELGPDTLPVFGPQTARADLKPFIKAGDGTLTLTGANTYQVPTRVAGGTLALAAGATLPPANDVTVDADATLDLGGANADLGRLAGAGQVLNGGTLTTTDGIHPGDADGYGTLQVMADSLAGDLHVAGGEDGACSTLAFLPVDEEAAPVDLSRLTLTVDTFDTLVSGTVYTILTAPQGLAGHFASTNLEGSHWNIQISATAVTLRKPGFAILLR